MTTELVLLKAVDEPVSTASSISEKMLNIFPNLPLMIATIIAVGIMFVFLVYFLKKPTEAMIKRRKDFIQANIDASVQQKEEAIVLTNQANEKLQEAHNQAYKVINNAKVNAEKVVIAYTAKAKNDSKHLLEEAAIDIANQQRQIEESARAKITETAVLLAQKIIQKEISVSKHQEMIDEFLDAKDIK
ncbi:F0F1 ATP synthase subunit B [Mycoplasma sp. Ms02]|uniref:F0F1 ATP synthase subunit B n=1 Tax=Mycoplasma sp. Ms02 TaxID=353851 RepID=UPI001C89C20C|nr:F0F1 ATP synthase subunit B [Mycoplasma sp. Ms02]QZE12436.1 F0F1 ATP synthase subunit B [Mycoplasma sp. Ms02]